VRLHTRIVRLNPGETKNGEGWVAAMSDELYYLLQACCEGKKPTDYVFTRTDKDRGIQGPRPLATSATCGPTC
jgi:hypothetical protein